MGATVSNLYNVDHNNYNNNFSFDILLCLQAFCKRQHLCVFLLTQLFAILLTADVFKPRMFPSHLTRLHTRLTELLLLVVCFVLPLSRELYCDFIFVSDWITTTYRLLCLAAFSRTLLWFHFCLCVVYTLPVVAFGYVAFLSLSYSYWCCCWFTYNWPHINDTTLFLFSHCKKFFTNKQKHRHSTRIAYLKRAIL